MDSLLAIAARLRAFRSEREWEQFHTPRNLAVSVAIESGELLEHFQWLDDEMVEAHVTEQSEAISEELADVLIYVVQLADVLEVSLAEAVDAKISRNGERYPAETARGTSRKHAEPGLRPAAGRSGP